MVWEMKMIDREMAKQENREVYDRGYYDGYHKGYGDKLSAVNKARKETKAEYLEKIKSLEICKVYPFSMIYEVCETEEPLMLSAESINKAMSEALTERERRILEMRYRDGMTYDEIGNVIGVTKERVRQIAARSERKLRYPPRLKKMACVTKADYDAVMAELQEMKDKCAALEELLNKKQASENDIIGAVVKSNASRGIENLDLSVRSYNCLRRANINTIAELSDVTYPELIKVRNLGKRSAQEICQKMSAIGLPIQGAE